MNGIGRTGLVAVVGAWLVVSNWVLSHALPETAPAALGATIFWNSVLTGASAILLGGTAIAAFTLWEEWADMAIGLWLVVSPSPISSWRRGTLSSAAW